MSAKIEEREISEQKEEEQIQNVCGIHGKPLELYCISESCRHKICSRCALFGDHKVDPHSKLDPHIQE